VYFLLLLIKDHIRKPFDLVHAHSTYPTGFVAVVLQKIFNIPALVSLNAAEGSALEDIEFGDLLHGKRARINKWVINNAKMVTALSHFHRNEICKNLGVKREIKVIYRGIDMERFYFERSDLLRRPVVLLSVGYLNAIKDPGTLLHAFSEIQEHVDCTLIVIGKDYTNGSIEALIRKLNIAGKVKLEGFVSHDRIHEYFRKADVLLHTSRYESQGMVVAEALASGTLVCGTSVGLMHDLSGECCVTVPPQDATGLARAVIKLLDDSERIQSLRKKGYAWSKHNSLERSSETIMDLYRGMIAGK
jgi:glycosyltransferase involved in cell wall biosynthesis